MQFGPAEPKIISSGLQANTPFAGAADRDGGLLDYVRLNDVTLQAWSPFHYGYFDGIFPDDPKYKVLNEKLETSGEAPGISEIAKADDVSLSKEEWYSIYKAAGHVIP